MTTQEFMSIYDRSVYQVRLELAMRCFISCEGDFEQAIAQADLFTEALMDEDVSRLKNRYNEATIN